MANPISSHAKHVPLVVLGCLSSTLSMMGSGCIVYMATREKARSSIANRLLLGLSLADLVSSTAVLLMPFLAPRWVGLPGASGTHASCSIAGFFFLSFALAGCCYNCYLSVYYCLVVRRNWKEWDFTRGKEIAAHAFAFVVPLGINAVAVATQSINPAPAVNQLCMYAKLPWGCVDNDEEEIHATFGDADNNSTTTASTLPPICQRSSRANIAKISMASGLITIVFSITGFVCTYLVWKTVHATIGRSSSYRFANHDSAPQQQEQLRQVCVQAVSYSLVYFNAFLWPLIFMVLSNPRVKTPNEMEETKDEPGLYALQILFWTFFPLQGALNFLVYTRQKAKRWKTVEPHRSWFWVYWKVIGSKEAPPRGPRNSKKTSLMSNGSSRRHLHPQQQFPAEEKKKEEGGGLQLAQRSEEQPPEESQPRALPVLDEHAQDTDAINNNNPQGPSKER